MPEVSRRERLERLLADDPKDAFLRYGLAMEFGGEGNHARQAELFGELLRDNPSYIPAYFHRAQALLQLNQADEARETLETGIVQARRTGDMHAAEEMNELLGTL